MNPESKIKQMPQVGGLAGWLLSRLKSNPQKTQRLALLERINLAPRQTLALVEADGRRLLVATGPDGAPSFYALDAPRRASDTRRRVSW
jgi:flagellar biogenesis protein FliO